MKRNKSLTGKAVALATIALAVTASPGAYAAQAGQPLQTKAPILAAAHTQNAEEHSVPLRQVAEQLGAKVSWKKADQSATLIYGENTVIVKSGSDTATVNGKNVSAKQAVHMVKGSMYVSLSFLNETLGTRAGWQSDKSAVVFEQQDYVGKAASFVYHLYKGSGQEAAKLMNDQLKEVLPEEAFAYMAEQYPLVYGAPEHLVTSEVVANAVHTNAIIVYDTGAAQLQITVRFDAQGLIDDLDFQAANTTAYTKPAYDTGLYSEREVVIGEGAYALPGTLTLPEGTEPFPVVILVHGSGPHDRDSTLGGVKVFKDLAAGLASKGIAVLRYEKVTKEHTFKISSQADFTLKQESVDDTLRAIKLLQGIKEVDASRIFVAGHSQGGYVMPTLLAAAEGKSVAGAILLSAPSDNLTDVIVEQQNEALDRMRSLKLPSEQLAAQEQAVATWTQIVDLIHDKQYSETNLPANFPLQPAYYWFEQRDYDPAATAKAQTTPLLVLQGENDWQVTMKQFAGWKEALAERKDVTFKSYEHVNHLLTEYKSLSIGMEYGQPANVSSEIVQDIANWIDAAAK